MSTTFQEAVIVNAPVTVTSTSATAFTVAPAGANYALQVDCSTSSAATGLTIKPAAAGGALALLSDSIRNEREFIEVDAKGSGDVTVAGVSTGDVVVATGGGSVGIGTASPTARLHVNGGVVLSAGYYLCAEFFKSDLADGEKLDVNIGKGQATDESFTFRYHYNAAANGYFSLQHWGDSDSIVIEKGGNVGLGVTAPASRLDIGGGALTMLEMTAPAAPASNKCVLYAEDNGSGKTRLMVRFSSGAAQQVAIEP